MSVSLSDLKSYMERCPTIIFLTKKCESCDSITPIFETLKNKDTYGIKFFIIDIDLSPHIARMFQVSIVPAFYIYNRNCRIREFYGNEELELNRSYAFLTSCLDLE